MPNSSRPFDRELPDGILALAGPRTRDPLAAHTETESGTDPDQEAGARQPEDCEVVGAASQSPVARCGMPPAQRQFLRFVRDYVKEAEKRGQVREDVVRQLLQLLERESSNTRAARFPR